MPAKKISLSAGGQKEISVRVQKETVLERVITEDFRPRVERRRRGVGDGPELAPGMMAQGDVMGYSPVEDTSTTLLQVGLLAPQGGKNIGIYHCPADHTTTTASNGGRYPRVRSVSMNAFVGPWNDAGSPVYSGWAQFIKLTAIRNPSMIFVFLDESPQTLNDGWYVFCNNGPDGNLWSDMPAYYHNGACGFSFADGHSEIKRWLSSVTKMPFDQWPIPTGSDKRDFLWVSERATYKSK